MKRIAEAYHASDGKSTLTVIGSEIAKRRAVGLVDRITDISFTLDDGMARIDINTWINQVSDANGSGYHLR